ncbi:hypothetical protein [Helicobacter sp. MIT 05-5294]|uniref:hypothetical protein n=1 Tax=Helicobacter sp. MIT 05-5294 TaxID=1548150 RepID=UPI0018837535|nr:hypothetical protein [Helicobacter sp. MIT 05-5294]
MIIFLCVCLAKIVCQCVESACFCVNIWGSATFAIAKIHRLPRFYYRRISQ